MDTAGDPGWKYHIATAKIWSMATAYLSESLVLQIKAADYGIAVQNYVKGIERSIPCTAYFNLAPLEKAIAELGRAKTVVNHVIILYLNS
jgi:N-acetylated-alpha-linked acidic dipeptidase